MCPPQIVPHIALPHGAWPVRRFKHLRVNISKPQVHSAPAPPIPASQRTAQAPAATSSKRLNNSLLQSSASLIKGNALKTDKSCKSEYFGLECLDLTAQKPLDARGELAVPPVRGGCMAWPENGFVETSCKSCCSARAMFNAMQHGCGCFSCQGDCSSSRSECRAWAGMVACSHLPVKGLSQEAFPGLCTCVPARLQRHAPLQAQRKCLLLAPLLTCIQSTNVIYAHWSFACHFLANNDVGFCFLWCRADKAVGASSGDTLSAHKEAGHTFILISCNTLSPNPRPVLR